MIKVYEITFEMHSTLLVVCFFNILWKFLAWNVIGHTKDSLKWTRNLRADFGNDYKFSHGMRRGGGWVKERDDTGTEL